ncbi:MAG TPA: mannitol dehydrogenase family protein [Arthrobacter sp.]|nr:mannitol dehydrogenase family protein [Arthrobacter sp.]
MTNQVISQADQTGPDSAPTRLDRSTYPSDPAADIRIVHIGLGAFHRAHQAWYTDQVDPDRQWGIAAFTGRSPAAAEVLSEQDGLYTLVTRSAEADDFEVMQSIVAAYDGADLDRLRDLIAAPATAIITLTVTEAGYLLDADGRLDTTDATVADDVARLRRMLGRPDSSGTGAADSDSVPASMAARVVVSLNARRDAGSGPIAIVSCDNLAANGTAASHAITDMAAEVDPELARWIGSEVSFVDTSIDRITPRTTDDDRVSVARATGYADQSPVIAEPFHSWVLRGEFPAGRPAWEDAGAVFVDEIEHFERRKLWLLNGAHSLLAYAGSLRGHGTVAEALDDPRCAGWVEEFWNEAQRHLTEPELEIPSYRAALLARFSNSRIAHHLAQIGMDGSSKLRMRAVPVLKAEREAGRSGEAAARMIAAWTDFVSTADPLRDARAEQIGSALEFVGRERVRQLVTLLDPDLAEDAAVIGLIESLCGSFR